MPFSPSFFGAMDYDMSHAVVASTPQFSLKMTEASQERQ